MSVSHFGVWRALCATLTLPAAGAAVAWSVSVHGTLPGWTAGLVLLAMPAAWLTLRPHPAFQLRWDTRDWLLGDVPGQVEVAIDAGGWMLLRFSPVGSRRCRWLPVQRLGHEAAWHTLRCTLYCARPPADRLVADL